MSALVYDTSTSGCVSLDVRASAGIVSVNSKLGDLQVALSTLIDNLESVIDRISHCYVGCCLPS